MASFESFSRRMMRRAKQWEKAMEEATRQGALAALRAAVQSTPVDTGNAKLNWNASLKSPKVTVRNLAEGTTVPSDQAGKESLARGGAVIRRFKVGDGVVWLTNGVKYIKGLDTGGVSKKGGQMSAKAEIAGRRAIKASLARGIFRGR